MHLQSGFYCASRLPLQKRKKEKEYKESIKVTFSTIVKRDEETWPVRRENVPVSFFWSVRNVVKQEGSFFIEKFSHSNTAKKCEENIKTKTKRREKKWICTKTTYHATTGLVFQYITTPEKPCATQIYNFILMYQSNIGLLTRKPFSEVWKSESSAYNQMSSMSPQL